MTRITGKLTDRFWVFGGEFPTEPRGGMRDLIATYETEVEAVAWARGYHAGRFGGWVYVFDSHAGKELPGDMAPGSGDLWLNLEPYR